MIVAMQRIVLEVAHTHPEAWPLDSLASFDVATGATDKARHSLPQPANSSAFFCRESSEGDASDEQAHARLKTQKRHPVGCLFYFQSFQ